ncbi:hypothetical protein ACERCG_11985 [Mannheimia sp. E30BD]|uniref:hypothetical protein n=1 Tax=Mannheimia sp. E30BD TaxID=3278708 RepID=UPI00359E661D
MMNPKILEALKESDDNPNAYSISVDGKNCCQVMQMMALQHTARKLSKIENDRNAQSPERQISSRLLST